MDAVLIVGVLYIIGLVICLSVNAVFYIFNSIALKKLAEGRQLERPWLAWVPIANGYLLGEIADDIEAYNGKTANCRKALLWLGIVQTASCLLMLACALIGTAMSSAGNSDGTFYFMPIIVILYVCLFFASTAFIVFRYVAAYKIFKDYAPESATIFLVLSIFLSVSYPFLLFSLRNKPSFSMRNSNRY